MKVASNTEQPVEDIGTLKAWCYWKRVCSTTEPEDLLMVKAIEDIISQAGTWKAKFEREAWRVRELRITLRLAWSTLQDIVLRLNATDQSDPVLIACNNAAVDAQVRMNRFFEDDERRQDNNISSMAGALVPSGSGNADATGADPQGQNGGSPSGAARGGAKIKADGGLTQPSPNSGPGESSREPNSGSPLLSQSAVCLCGHAKRDHIYEEGACRPGFICRARCSQFTGNEGAKDD